MKPLRFIKAFALVGVVFAAATGCKKDSEPAPVPEIKIETPAISLPEEASEMSSTTPSRILRKVYS